MRQEGDILGYTIEKHIGIPFRQENKGCRCQEASKCSDVETIDMMYWQHVESDVHAVRAIPCSRLLCDPQ